uniref:Uncharacterized protein n=1 Tax=Anguilla anguilla TaxID=7936 RepID=A0A0E9SLS9_ANGAN
MICLHSRLASGLLQFFIFNGQLLNFVYCSIIVQKKHGASGLSLARHTARHCKIIHLSNKEKKSFSKTLFQI